MTRTVLAGCTLLFFVATAPAQEGAESKRGFFGRMLHPFHSTPQQKYQDARLRGLVLELQLSPLPVKLSEVRQLEVKVTLVNQSKRAVELTFPTEQRIEIHLLNPLGKVLSNWSENRVFAEKQAIVLLNPQERLEYSEMITTRELAPGKVFTAEAFFPSYPELKARQKFLTAP